MLVGEHPWVIRQTLGLSRLAPCLHAFDFMPLLEKHSDLVAIANATARPLESVFGGSAVVPKRRSVRIVRDDVAV
jgi:hypothetical protein